MAEEPYVALACLCEKALQEKDGVYSLIRIVDIFYVPEPPDPPDEEVAVAFYAVISLRVVELEGSFDLALQVSRPDGTDDTMMEPEKVGLSGEQQNINVIVQIAIRRFQLGQYWLNVLWDGKVLTTVPFRLIDARDKPATRPEVSTE